MRYEYREIELESGVEGESLQTLLIQFKLSERFRVVIENGLKLERYCISRERAIEVLYEDGWSLVSVYNIVPTTRLVYCFIKDSQNDL